MTYNTNRLLVRTSAPASEPVSLAEAKLFLRVDMDDENSLISDVIVAARMSAEQWLRRSLISQTWKLAYDDYIDDAVSLPMGPVASIASVVTIARDGSTQVIDDGVYWLNAAKDTLLLDSPIFGGRVEITYNTGYGNASAVPTPIKQGILAHVAILYEERGMLEQAGLPLHVQALYAPWREVML